MLNSGHTKSGRDLSSGPDSAVGHGHVAPGGEGLSLSHLLRTIWRKKQWIFIPLAVVVAIVYTGVNLVSPRFTSQASILVEDNQSVFARAGGTDGGRATPDQETVTSQVQLLLSRDLAADVVRDLKLTELAEFDYLLKGISLPKRILVAIGIARDPRLLTAEERAIKSYYEKIAVYKVSTSRVITIEFTAKNPELAARIANAVADHYIALQVEAGRQSTVQAAEWLGGQVGELRAKVEAAEARVEQYKSANGLLRGSNDASLSSQQLSELNSQLIVAQTRRAEAQARAQTIREVVRAGGNLAASTDVVNSPLIQRLLEQQVILARRVAELRPTLLPQHPRMRELMAELADLKLQIRAEAEKVALALESEARVAGARENAIRASLTALKQEVERASGHEVELRALQREARAQRELLESFLTRFREASARDNRQATPAIARIVSRATASNDPSFPLKGGILIISAIATLLISIGWIGAAEVLNSLQNGPNAPVPGGISMRLAAQRQEPLADLAPPRPAAVAPLAAVQAVQATHPLAAAAEKPANAGERPKPALSTALEAQHYPPAMRELADRVVALKSDDACLRLLVTSPQRLARDNFAATNLARLLTVSGHQTILIDGNLHMPRLTAQLNLGGGPGFSDLLAGRSSFAEVIHRDPNSRLHVIGAGSLKADAVSLMSEERVEQLLDALEGNYGFIVIDLPPVMLSPEPRTLARHADLAVVVEDTLPGAQRLAARAGERLRDQNRVPIDIICAAPEIAAEVRARPLGADLRIA